ncbi:Eco57I restriction-modification methylase domain-containing protein [Brachyspira pilosicoli]|uniref:Eco57I restriction-modification methylase domain-containing protein n=1 Tax=Brachyspira pilosicoli TaxID=52584 RepID=UPI000C767447|nr:TaqI-like C-terminal specificity domain-containing protein [Brachyspira pilosicoli]PLV58528.1 bifunctional endonuclease/methyltransferase [Brachyspira pilosicoli SP16]
MANYNSAKQKAYDVILHLVDNFQNGIKSKNETETRRYYIDKFFEALGWDVGNEKGKREVIHEDIVKVKGKTKFPDYGFYFKGKRVFFVEAKDTKVDIKNDSRPAFQLRSYAWSAKLGVSILTDFEEFAVYDCTVRPKENDRTEAARIKYFTYEDYLKEGVFDYIYDLFERENVANGSLDAYSENLCNRKGSETVDVHFLSTLDELRTKLAVVISKLNREMSEKDINYAVQQIIDRIIFLRVAEDRNVENYGLLALANPKNKNEDDFKNYGFNGENSYYENLNYIFDRANEKYNSGLFDEDAIVRNLNIDDKTIKDIIDELYTPKNPYQFSVIPVEIIGNAYEQFLGKTISIDKNHKAVIELKPEVRKAGGVYYTPEYIVDYIVANTVGEAIKGKTPDEIVNIKILDPACGSGSFLLGAYKYLLNYHKEYFLKNKTKKYMGSRYEIIDESGNLALWVRKQILINNIFGVDIDSNAVEVAKLSLLLKSFEDSFNVNEYGQGSLLNEKILPSLDNNIKCGNSLIGNDFYESHLDLDDATLYKINCFDWEEEFKSIFKGGGFDVVIGNPPYVFVKYVDWADDVKDYFSSNYDITNKDNKSKSNQSGKINLYTLFIFRAIKLLKENGLFSFIVPNGLLRTTTYDMARKFILDNYHIDLIADLKDGVFKGVTAPTIIFKFSKSHSNDDTKIIDANCLVDGFVNESKCHYINQSIFLENTSYTFSIFSNPKETVLFKKMESYNKYLGEITSEIIEGIVCKKEQILLEKPNDPLCRKFLEGKNIKKYKIDFNNKYIIFDRKKLHRARPDEVWNSDKKIIIQRISGGLHPIIAALDTENYYSFASTNLIIIKDEFKDIYSYELICALLNSKLINFYYVKNFTNASTLTVNISKTFLEKIPLPLIDLNNKEDKEVNDKIVTLVDNIIALNKNLSVEKNPNSITMLNRQINAVDKQIDSLVYKLYNLNDEEVKIIEGE